MYQYIKGTITEKGLNYLVLECVGIGYYMTASSTTLASFVLGEQAKVYTKLIVREDAHLLCAFATLNEREFFENLISVSGIGQKVAIGMLSDADYSDILTWIVSGDEKALTKLSGIGKKTAQRLIVELRDKLKKRYGEVASSGNLQPLKEDNQDVMIALMGLGFSSDEIAKMLSGVDVANLSVEEAIRMALSNN